MHDLMRDNQTFSFKVYKFIGFKFKKLERRLQLLMFKDTNLKEISYNYNFDSPSNFSLFVIFYSFIFDYCTLI